MDLDFDLDFDDTVARRVARYVRQVSRGLGLRGDSSFVESEPRPSAYLALEGRLPGFPDHDVALLWDEQRGWSVAVEHPSGELKVVARLDHDGPPPATDVVRWVKRLLRGAPVSSSASVHHVGDELLGDDPHLAVLAL